MASIQCAEKSLVSEDIANKSRAIVAEKECLNKADANAPQRYELYGTLRNRTIECLNVFNSKLWKGYTMKDYTNPLDTIGFFEQAALIGGVKAAVVYGGKNGVGVECGWLVAWSSDDSGRKVYADCGRRSKFDNINWSQIEEKLNESDFRAHAYDQETATTLSANFSVHPDESAVSITYGYNR